MPYTTRMQFFPNTYLPGSSCVHRFDARFKLGLLLVFSIGIFFVDSWLGLGLAALLVVALQICARISPKRMAAFCVPLAIILLIIWVCNAFTLGEATYLPAQGSIPLVGSAGLLESAGFSSAETLMSQAGLTELSSTSSPGHMPIPLLGSLGFSPVGALAGAFYVVRILIMFLASFIMVLTTSSQELLAAFSALLKPLRIFKAPVDDIAVALALALRFIPLIAEEAFYIRQAQYARGASFGRGGALARVRAWFPVLIPLFTSLFRRVDRVAEAMDARCYGAIGRYGADERYGASERTSLVELKAKPQVICAAFGIALACVFVALFL